jgi:hypothetical protein
MGGQKGETQMNSAKTLEQLLQELQEQDGALREARATLATLGDERLAVRSADLEAIEDACSARSPAVARGWLGFRC